jgi:hypothetical protein
MSENSSRALSPNFCLVIAIFSLLLGVLEPNIGTIGLYVVGIYCIFQCRLKYLPALFICHLSPNSIEIVTSYLNMTRLEHIRSLSIFEPLLPPFLEVSQIIFCIYIIISLFMKPFKFKNSRLRLLFWFWVICVVGGVINTVYSLLDGNEMWTRGLRAVLTVGCCFYGLLLAQRSKIEEDFRLVSVWLWLILAFGILVALHVFWSHMLFWLVSIASLLMAFQVHYRNSKIFRFSALAYLPVSLGSSLTMLAISWGTIFAVWFSMSKSRVRRNFVVKGIVLLLILGPFISLGAGALSESLGLGDNIEMVSLQASLSDRVIFKFAGDRLPLWTSAYSQIVEGSFWFPTSGRSLQVIHFSEYTEWNFGSHNSYLEILRNNGLFFGIILLFVIINLLIMTLRNRTDSSTAYSLFGISLCTTAGFGLLLGDFILEPTVGPIFWTTVGVVIWRLQQLNDLSTKTVSVGR